VAYSGQTKRSSRLQIGFDSKSGYIEDLFCGFSSFVVESSCAAHDSPPLKHSLMT